MHGVIHIELKRYLTKKHGASAWEAALQEAGLAGRTYDSTHAYPDEETGALVCAAAKVASMSRPALLEAFGEFIAPALLAFFPRLIDPAWKTLDLIVNTEGTIHTVVRTAKAGALPPELKASRIGPREVQVDYSSRRGMCGLAKGIIKGVARHYQEEVEIQETQCMSQGAQSCILMVRIPAS